MTAESTCRDRDEDRYDGVDALIQQGHRGGWVDQVGQRLYQLLSKPGQTTIDFQKYSN